MSGNSSGKFGGSYLTSYGSFTTSGNCGSSQVYSVGLGGGGSNSLGYQYTINVAHTHNMQHNHTVDISHTHTISSNGGTESRTNNFTYKIWVRTA